MKKNKLNRFLKILGIAIIVFLVGLIATSLASPSNRALTPQAQITFDAASYTLCNAEKGLAQAKLEDHLNGLLELTGEDLDRLYGKRTQDCPLS